MRLLRRPRIDTDEVADRWQPHLYLRLILLAQLERRRRRRSHEPPEH